MPRTHEQRNDKNAPDDTLRRYIKRYPASAQAHIRYFQRANEREEIEHFALFNAEGNALAEINQQKAAIARHRASLSSHLGRVSQAKFDEYAKNSGLPEMEERLRDMEEARDQRKADREAVRRAYDGNLWGDVRSFLVTHGGRGTKFRAADVELATTDNSLAALENMRGQLAKFTARFDEIDDAPVTVDDAMKKVDAELARCAAGGTPEVHNIMRLFDPSISRESGRRVQGEMKWPTVYVGGNLFAPAGIDLLVWAFRDTMRDKIRALIESKMPTNRAPIAIADRPALFAKLEAEMLTLERHECALVWQLKAAGQRVAHRGGADVRALLGIEVA